MHTEKWFIYHSQDLTQTSHSCLNSYDVHFEVRSMWNSLVHLLPSHCFSQHSAPRNNEMGRQIKGELTQLLGKQLSQILPIATNTSQAVIPKWWDDHYHWRRCEKGKESSSFDDSRSFGYKQCACTLMTTFFQRLYPACLVVRLFWGVYRLAGIYPHVLMSMFSSAFQYSCIAVCSGKKSFGDQITTQKE